MALIESLAGLDAANALASDPQVIRLAFGHLDFQLDLGMRASPDEPELAFARNALVAASRRARLPAPIDGVTTRTDDIERLTADARRARAGDGGSPRSTASSCSACSFSANGPGSITASHC